MTTLRLACVEGGQEGSRLVGLVTESGVVPVRALAGLGEAPSLRQIIDGFPVLRPELEDLAISGVPTPLDEVRFLAAVASPAKILCSMRTRPASGSGPPDLHVFHKGPAAAVGAGGRIVLPQIEGAEIFTHNVCVAVVIAGPAKRVAAADWRSAVFGYTLLVDVAARTSKHSRWKDGVSTIGGSFETFAPIGPWVIPAGEADDAAGLRIRLWVGDDLRQDYRVDDLDERIGEVVELASSVMTLHSGDVLALEGSPDGQGPLQEGDLLRVDIEEIGAMDLTVDDPHARRWSRDIRIKAGSDDADLRPRLKESGSSV